METVISHQQKYIYIMRRGSGVEREIKIKIKTDTAMMMTVVYFKYNPFSMLEGFHQVLLNSD